MTDLPPPTSSDPYDAVVIGSGFGGAMAARQLIHAGLRVLMVERGDWVSRGPHNWDPDGTVDLTPHYTTETSYRVRSAANGTRSAANGGRVGLYACVGGPSVFYGGVSLRFREADFHPDPEITADAGARWPFGYQELEPWYAEAERLLDVAGEAGADPTEPPRSGPYPQRPPPLSEASRRIAAAARRLGLSPFPLPLAINYREPEGQERRACVRCTTCDTFACAVGAKNDLATTVLPALLRRGLELRPGTVAVRLEAEGGRVRAVHCVERESGRRLVLRGRRVVLAAGALATPHLLLASGLERANPAGDAVGRHLMRHWNAIVFGVFPRPTDPVGEFHKQLGLHDFYFAPSGPDGGGRRKLGAIQQVQTPPIQLVREHMPALLSQLMSPRVDYLGGLLVIAEDQPRPENRLQIDPARADRYGLPRPTLTHRYSRRDRAAGRALVRSAKRVLREAGALFFYVHRIRTFSHAVGTVRMGAEPERAPVDPEGRYRGIGNLWVVDGSVLPTSAGLNPSLTIAALALRSGAAIAREAAA